MESWAELGQFLLCSTFKGFLVGMQSSWKEIIYHSQILTMESVQLAGTWLCFMFLKKYAGRCMYNNSNVNTKNEIVFLAFPAVLRSILEYLVIPCITNKTLQ